MPEESFTVDIKVNPFLKEYVQYKYGSDTIKLGRSDILASRIKYLLRTTPDNYKPVVNREQYIRIELHNFQLNNHEQKRINVRYRNYLNEDSQKKICYELTMEFRHVFHNYVLAFLRGGIINRHYFQQKDAIEDFCQTFQLRLSAINYDMLKKSWDRSRQKQIYLNTIKLKNVVTLASVF